MENHFIFLLPCAHISSASDSVSFNKSLGELINNDTRKITNVANKKSKHTTIQIPSQEYAISPSPSVREPTVTKISVCHVLSE